MKKVADLLSCIKSTKIFSEHCLPIRCFSCCFNKPSLTLVISINSALFFFFFSWKSDHLDIDLKSCQWCHEDITSCSWSNQTLFCGTISGKVIQLTSIAFAPLLSSNGAMELDSTPNESKTESSNSIERTNSIEEKNEFIHVSIHSTSIESEAVGTTVLNSILQSPHALQGGIVSIQETDDKRLIIHDGANLCVRNASGEWEYYNVPDGILCVNSSLQIITKSMQITKLNEFVQPISYFLPPLTDFALIDAIPLHSSSSSFLILFYIVTGMRTTSVDFRFQNYSLLSVAIPTEISWIPGSVLLPQCMKRCLLPQWSAGKLKTEQIQMIHCWLCKLMRQRQKLPLDIREVRRVLRDKRQENAAKTPDSFNMCCYCPCCKQTCLQSEGHLEWCCLGSLDLYCPVSGKLLLDSKEVKVCPCCQLSYLEASQCIFCGLKLRSMIRGPCLSQPINREFIHCYQGTESSVEESWNQIESYSV